VGSFASSAVLQKDLKEKTLQVWVQLADLKQPGAGALTVQDMQGRDFDAIVFAEGEALRWIPGSENHRRTQSFGGAAEDEVQRCVVQLCYTWAADGTVTAYRDGRAYGHSIQPGQLELFEKGQSQFLLGCRHGKPAEGRVLRGRIERARVYAGALTEAEVRQSCGLEPLWMKESEQIAALPLSSRVQAEALVVERARLSQELAQVGSAQSESPSDRAWQSLAVALVNAKEFIYLR
jgi:hypothetical protein